MFNIFLVVIKGKSNVMIIGIDWYKVIVGILSFKEFDWNDLLKIEVIIDDLVFN